jgi:hypothetical protein
MVFAGEMMLMPSKAECVILRLANMGDAITACTAGERSP